MKKVRIWVDDIREKPNENYIIARSVNETKRIIEELEKESIDVEIECVDIDHDAGDYANDGGDYIKLLDWFEETVRKYPIHIHSMNPVGVENMRAIIRKNNWKEV